MKEDENDSNSVKYGMLWYHVSGYVGRTQRCGVDCHVMMIGW